MLEKIFFDIVDDAMQIETYDQGSQLIKNIKDMYGLTHVAYIGVNIPTPTHGKHFVQSTYSDEWVNHYVDQKYVNIDPVVKNALTRLLPQEWSLKKNNNTTIQQLFNDARDCGIGRQGLTFPIRGKHGDTGIFSVNSNLKEKEWQHIKKICMRDFLTLANFFHNGVLKSAGGLPNNDGKSLSPREREVLKWAADGKSAWETAQILTLSERTIKFHLSNARTKLECLTTTQAVARAISLNLIDIY